MTLTRVAVLIGIAVAVMAANVLITILYMVVYGHVIDPGHEKAYYEEHVKHAAPYCSIVAGMPLMFFAGWWVGGWDPKLAVLSALIVWFTYASIDTVVLLASGITTKYAAIVAVSLLTKLGAVYLGATVAIRSAASP